MADFEIIEIETERMVIENGTPAPALMGMMAYRLHVLTLLTLDLEERMEDLLKEPTTRGRSRKSRKVEALLGEALQLVDENLCDMRRLEGHFTRKRTNGSQEVFPGYM